MIRSAASILGALSLSAAVLPCASLPAQTAAADVPRLMVVPFRGNEKGLGPQASEAVRTRVASDVPAKLLAVIAKSTVCANLEASGFSCDSVPDQLTARLLANSLRAETYLEGSIVKTGTSYKLETRFFVSGFPEMSQPLPEATGTKLGDLAQQISKSFQAARKEVPEFANCMHALQRKAYPEATKAAYAAIAVYPQSTIARVCLARTMVEQDAPSDAIVTVGDKVVELDPRNVSALLIIAAEYKKHGQKFRAEGQSDSAAVYYRKAVEAWSKVIAIEPRNVGRVQQIVNEIGASGQAPAAKAIIIKAVADNPGDPDLIKLEWQILLATRDTADMRQATVIGEDMVKVDTSAADTTFFVRQAAAYTELKDYKAAVATTTSGLNKFPVNVTLWSLCAKVQYRAGNAQGSLDCATKLVQLDPANGANHLLVARAHVDLQHIDPAVVAIRSALHPPGGTATPEVTAQAGQLLLIIGNQTYKAASAANPANKNDFKHAVALLAFADSVAPSASAKFVLGISAFKVGDADVRENQTVKKCDLAKEAQDYFVTAQINIAAGGSIDPKTAQQLLAFIQQYQPAVDGQLKKFCK